MQWKALPLFSLKKNRTTSVTHRYLHQLATTPEKRHNTSTNLDYTQGKDNADFTKVLPANQKRLARTDLCSLRPLPHSRHRRPVVPADIRAQLRRSGPLPSKSIAHLPPAILLLGMSGFLVSSRCFSFTSPQTSNDTKTAVFLASQAFFDFVLVRRS